VRHRVIVEDAVYTQFRDRLAASIEALQVLDPADDKTLSPFFCSPINK